MTTATPAVRHAFQIEHEESERPVSGAGRPWVLRLTEVTAAPASLVGLPGLRPVTTLRSSDLVADLRRARAARFTDRYEWLALRRRRAQIAARHALEE